MRSRHALLLAILTLSMGGCASVQPEPLAQQALRAQLAADRQAAQADVPPLTAPLTLEHAMARALKFNLQRRTVMLEEAIALGQLDVSRYDLLPQVLARAGYSSRSEDLITNSKDSVTGLPSLANPHISSQRQHTTAELGLSWNLLDFGVGYYNARQQADRVLIASEQRRRAMHQLMQDVRSAYWRVAGAQKLQVQVNEALATAEEALVDARKAESEKIRSPLESLRYQRQLLENLRLLESINQELASARVELQQLINVPLGQPMQLAEAEAADERPLPAWTTEQLEDMALNNNAELLQQVYQARIARLETRKVLTRLFPGLSFNYGLHYDSDRYLIHQNWNEAGLQLSWNLMNVLSGPAQKKLAEAGVALADQRRVATQMAVLAQVHLAQLQYHSAWRLFQRADAIWSVDSRIATHSANREEARAQSKLDRVANTTTAILSLLRRYQSLAQLHASAARLQATVGMEPAPGSVQELPLDSLTQQIRQAQQAWQTAAPTAAAPASAP